MAAASEKASIPPSFPSRETVEGGVGIDRREFAVIRLIARSSSRGYSTLWRLNRTLMSSDIQCLLKKKYQVFPLYHEYFNKERERQIYKNFLECH